MSNEEQANELAEDALVKLEPNSPVATTAGHQTGATTIDVGLQFEVQVVATAAVRSVAADIARQVAARLNGGLAAPLVVVADDRLVGAMAEWRVAAVRMAALEQALESLQFDLEGMLETDMGGVAESLSAVTASIKAVSDVLSWFRVDTTWSARTVDVDGVLRPALVGQLLARGVEPFLPDAVAGPASAGGGQTLLDDLRRLLRLKTRLEAAASEVAAVKAAEARAAARSSPGGAAAQPAPAHREPAEPAGDGVAEGAGAEANVDAPAQPEHFHAEPLVAELPLEAHFPADPLAGLALEPAPEDPMQKRVAELLAAVDTFVGEFSGKAPDKPGLALMLAASEACAAADAAPAAFLLEAKVLKAGGHFVERKHFLAGLFGIDTRRFGAGATASFSLTDLKRRRVMLSDVLFHVTDNVRFPSYGNNPRPSNLGRVFSDPGWNALSYEAPAGATVPKLIAGAGGALQGPAPSPNGGGIVAPAENAGDDEAAESGDRTAPSVPDDVPEGALDWRLGKSLETLRNQVNAKAPRRNKASDGSIGDPAHQNRNSDHNAWVRDGAMGVVTAIDITNDPDRGCSAEALAEALRTSRDPRLKYIIWNRRIVSASVVDGVAAWTWRTYTGSNPHNKHVHISVKPEKATYDLTSAWRI